MPMDSTSLIPVLSGSLVSNGIVGPNSFQLATGLATGLSEYATTGIIVESIDVGSLGAGIGSGVGVILDPAVFGSMNAAFISYAIVGLFGPVLATAISDGFTQAFLQAIVSTISAGVGIGSGEAVLVPDPAVSVASFLSGFASAGLIGSSMPQLAEAVASGLDQVLPTSTSTLIIAGPPSVFPGGGTGVGILS